MSAVPRGEEMNLKDPRLEYLNLTPLVNREGGFRARLDGQEAEILQLTSEFLQTAHTPEGYRAFQEVMTRRAFDALRSVRQMPPGEDE